MAIADNRPCDDGYTYSLAFLVLRGTRGFRGVPIVGACIIDHWNAFVGDFDDFCDTLVRECRQVCHKHGKTYLSHREGRHTCYSGMYFIETLEWSSCRENLTKLATVWASTVSRLMRLREGDRPSVSELMMLGDALPGTFPLCIQKGKPKFAQKYNAMDILRGFTAVFRSVLGCQAPVYDNTIHEWYLSRQAKKYREAQEGMLEFFGALSCQRMSEAVESMRVALGPGSTVCASTMYVLFCETRQAINEYSLSTVCFLVERYEADEDLRSLVAAGRKRLLENDDDCMPHTLQMLRIIHRHLGLSRAALQATAPLRILTVAELAETIGRTRICPKVSWEGIPEWVVLSHCMGAVLERMPRAVEAQGYEELIKSLREVRRPYNRSDGSRMNIRELRNAVSLSTGKSRKRGFRELERAVVAAGGHYLSSFTNAEGERVRRRMSKAAMEEYLRVGVQEDSVA